MMSMLRDSETPPIPDTKHSSLRRGNPSKLIKTKSSAHYLASDNYPYHFWQTLIIFNTLFRLPDHLGTLQDAITVIYGKLDAPSCTIVGEPNGDGNRGSKYAS